MPTEVLVALIGAGQAITLALLAPVLLRLGKVKRDVAKVKTDAAASRYQVENDHIDEDGNPINMRVENDSRHAETKRWFEELRSDVAGRFATVGRDIGGLREEIRIDRSATNRRFESLEDRIKEKP